MRLRASGSRPSAPPSFASPAAAFGRAALLSSGARAERERERAGTPSPHSGSSPAVSPAFRRVVGVHPPARGLTTALSPAGGYPGTPSPIRPHALTAEMPEALRLPSRWGRPPADGGLGGPPAR